MNLEIKEIIRQADLAIKEERFDDLLNFYCEDAILVVRPEEIVRGKDKIKEAFIRIAKYFDNSIEATQGKMLILETEDTALVLSQTILNANNKEESEYSMERKATYIFRKIDNKWLCSIDNSYGTTLI